MSYWWIYYLCTVRESCLHKFYGADAAHQTDKVYRILISYISECLSASRPKFHTNLK